MSDQRNVSTPPDYEPAVGSELARELSLLQVTLMGMGMMIGAGVFIGIGISMGRAGPGGVLLTFALTSLVALFTAMSFAELSSAIPRAGGAYNFARIAFGRGPSFLAGWMEWFASSVAGSLYAVVFATYTLTFLLNGVLGLELTDRQLILPIKIVAPLTALLFLYINYRGASETGKIGAIFTLAQTVFVAGIAVVGVIAAIVHPDRLRNFHPFLPNGWSALLATMGFIYVAFEGFEVIAQAGDETIEPKRNIPKAMLYSVLVVTVTYVGVSIATVVAIRPGPEAVVGRSEEVWQWIGTRGPAGDGETGFGEAVGRMIPFGGALVAMAVIFSSTSALNATIYSATRASYALGRDRMLPAAFARISSRRRTPYVALAATGVIVLAVAGALPTRDVASCASMMFLFLFLLVNLCVVKVRLNMGDELSYGFVMPLFPVFPIVAVLAQATLAAFIVHMSPTAWIVAPAWIAVGACVYLLYSRQRTVTTEDEVLIVEETRHAAGGVPADSASPPGRGDPPGYRIMVAVANPDSALQLVRATYVLAGARQAEVDLLHMVPVPLQVPLADAGSYMQEGQEGIVEVMLYLAPLFPISTTLRYCRSVARGIVTAARERRCDLLIMGWHGPASRAAGQDSAPPSDSSAAPATAAAASPGTGRPASSAGIDSRRRYFRLGSTVDPVIERAPCNVAVLKNFSGDRKFRRVLVPLAGGPNGAFSLEVASLLADPDEGRIVAFTVRRPPRPGRAERRRFDVGAFVEANRGRLALPPERVETRVAEADDVVHAILTAAAEEDLIVLGCTREPLLRRLSRETIPDTVARLCDRPLVMVNAATPLHSWVRRWI